MLLLMVGERRSVSTGGLKRHAVAVPRRKKGRSRLGHHRSAVHMRVGDGRIAPRCHRRTRRWMRCRCRRPSKVVLAFVRFEFHVGSTTAMAIFLLLFVVVIATVVVVATSSLPS